MTNLSPIPASAAVIACPQCGDRTRLYGIEPHVRLAHTEIHTYVCDVCNATEAVTVPMARQTDEIRVAAQQ